MQLFLFGIGGSGARIIRSFVHLLASGANLGSITKVVPIIIDTDSNNGDKEITLNTINSYIETRNELYKTEGQRISATYFKTEITHFIGGKNDAFADLASNKQFIDWLQDGGHEPTQPLP